MIWGLTKKLGHFLLDQAGIQAKTSKRQQANAQIMQQALIECGQMDVVNHLGLRNRVLDELKRLYKTDLVGINGCFARGIVNHGSDEIMSQEQPIKLLEYTKRLLAPKRLTHQPLMGINFINHQFYFPPLVVRTDQICGRILLWIDQGSYDAMNGSWITKGRVGEAIRNHSEHHAPRCRSAVIGRCKFDQ